MSSATRLVRYVEEHLFLFFAAMTHEWRLQNTIASLRTMCPPRLHGCVISTLLSLIAVSWTNSVGPGGLTSS